METISEEDLARFTEGAKSTSSEKLYKTQEEWEKKGLLNFRRRVLGLCGRQSVKSLDELTEISAIASGEEGKDFIEELYGKEENYGKVYLEFTRAQNKKGLEVCRIKRY